MEIGCKMKKNGKGIKEKVKILKGSNNGKKIYKY